MLDMNITGLPSEAEAENPGFPPTPRSTGNLADLADELADLRIWAGAPSYGQLATAVGNLRRSRGNGRDRHAPGRTTVFDCFRPDRKRIDVNLVVDLAQAMGAAPHQLVAWRALARAAVASTVRTAPVEPPGPVELPGLVGDA